MLRLFFDTETTGFPVDNQPDDHPAQPHLCEVAATLYDNAGNLRQAIAMIVRPDGFIIPPNVAALHGISQDMATEHGHQRTTVLRAFDRLMKSATMIVAHNLAFDLRIMRIAYAREGWLFEPPVNQFCTMTESADIVKVGRNQDGSWRWPKLAVAYQHFTGREMKNAHQALADCAACKHIYEALRQQGRAP